jgi:hypothetical protein
MRELIEEGLELHEIRHKVERRFGFLPPHWEEFDPLQKVLYDRNFN